MPENNPFQTEPYSMHPKQHRQRLNPSVSSPLKTIFQRTFVAPNSITNERESIDDGMMMQTTVSGKWKEKDMMGSTMK